MINSWYIITIVKGLLNMNDKKLYQVSYMDVSGNKNTTLLYLSKNNINLLNYLLDKEVNCAELQLKEVELENLKSF